MKLVLSAPVSHARAMVKTFNILAQLYARTNELQISLHKSGIRMRNSKGYFDVMPQTSEGTMQLHVAFSEGNATPNNVSFGMASVFLATYRALVEYTSDKIRLDEKRSELPPRSDLDTWSLWMIAKIRDAEPDLAKQVIPKTYLDDHQNELEALKKRTPASKRPLPKPPSRA